MSYTIRELNEEETFDPLTLCPQTPFTQAKFYGGWQKSLGRPVKRFIVSDGGEVVAYFQMIVYPLVREKNYIYIPYGPVVKNLSPDLMGVLKKELFGIAKKNNAVFVRLDLTPPVLTEADKSRMGQFFTASSRATYHSAYFQPRTEWFLDLRKAEEELLNEMHEKTRYSIRTGMKRGATTEVITSDFPKYFPIFYELMSETSKRNGFSLHDRVYYEDIFKKLNPANTFLVIAKYKDTILVADLFIRYGDIVNYVFSGSSSEYRETLPAYVAQWEAIRHSKKLGDRFYNFGGVASGELYKGWEGLTRFKRRFGGFEVVHSNFYDVVAQPFWYHAYNFRKILKKIIGS